MRASDMGSHAASEDMEDDVKEWLEAALEDSNLGANILVCLSRPEAYVPWRQLQAATRSQPQQSTLTRWGRRKARSVSVTMEAILAAKREALRRTSPTTPLSWSGGSGTSGSACEDGESSRSAKKRRTGSAPEVEASSRATVARKRKAEIVHRDGGGIPAPVPKIPKVETKDEDGERSRTPVAKSLMTETVHEDGVLDTALAAGSPAVVGSFTGGGSNKEVVVESASATATASLKSGGQVEPLRVKLTGQRTNPVIVGRQGKKLTLPKYLEMEKSILQEKEMLQKELSKQKEIYSALLEKNMELKRLKSNLQSSQVVSIPCITSVAPGEATIEPHRLQSNAESQTVKEIHTSSVVSKEERPEQVKCTSSSSSVQAPSSLVQAPSSSVQARTFLIDLNTIPGDDD